MKRYEPSETRAAVMLDDQAGRFVLHSQAAALLQLAEEKLQRAERERIKAETERDHWKNCHDGLRAVYRDIGNALGANMPAELVNEVARRRMRQLQVAREALQKMERQPILTAEGLAFTNAARNALEEIKKC